MVAAPWEALASLVDSVRRALYDYVRRQDHPVTREEAADAQRISRGLAAFHLDKLVGVGLLRARYEAPATAQPRGRGRTPKVYETAPGCVSLSIPQRRYDLIGDILAQAVAEQPTDAGTAALDLARDRGETAGREFTTEATALPDALDALGFEPYADGGRITLRNCPFHQLATTHTALVCGLNHAYLSGLLAGMSRDDLHASLAPQPTACCVQIHPVR